MIFHTLFDLSEFKGLGLGSLSAYWQPVRVLGAATFLAIVGISLSISYRRRGVDFPKHALVRGLGLLGLGLLVTAATYYYSPRNYVSFGILSLIGASIIFSIFVVARPILSLVLGSIFLVEGMLLSIAPMLPTMLGWIGPSPFMQDAYDYYTLLPWMGLVFIGIYLGYRIHPSLDKPSTIAPRIMAPITWCGRHTLIIYMLHQPIILFLIRLSQGF